MDTKLIFLLLTILLGIITGMWIDMVTDVALDTFFCTLDSITALPPESPFAESQQFAISMRAVAFSLLSIAGWMALLSPLLRYL